MQTSRRRALVPPRVPRQAAGPDGGSDDGRFDSAANGDTLRRPARVLLLVFGTLTALAVLALFVGATRTDEAFAWTIQPPLAAAFLGAGYASGCLLVLLTLRAGTWRQARWPLATILVFAVLTLVASLLHLDRFHLPGSTALSTVAAWLWLFVYVVVPVGMTVVLVIEERRMPAPVARPAGEGRQPWWFTVSLVVQGVVLAAAGVALFLGIDGVVSAWPWDLTPLVAQVTAAWLLAFAVAAALAVRQDVAELGPASAGYLTFGLAELLAVAVYRDDAHGGAALTAYLLMAGWVAVTGAAGLWMSRRAVA